MTTKSTSCAQLPHGPYSVVVTTVAVLAWMAALGQDGCNYAHVQGPIVGTLGNVTSPWIAMGLVGWNEPTLRRDGTNQTEWTISGGGHCQLYPPSFFESVDSLWSTGKTLAFLAQCIGGGGSLFVACSVGMVFSKATWKWTGYLLGLASLCQAISVLVWLSNDMCQWNTCSIWNGSGMDIVASTLWLVAGGLMVVYYPSRRFNRSHSHDSDGTIDDAQYPTGDDDQDHDHDHEWQQHQQHQPTLMNENKESMETLPIESGQVA